MNFTVPELLKVFARFDLIKKNVLTIEHAPKLGSD